MKEKRHNPVGGRRLSREADLTLKAETIFPPPHIESGKELPFPSPIYYFFRWEK
jgi:hypothetical protein